MTDFSQRKKKNARFSGIINYNYIKSLLANDVLIEGIKEILEGNVKLAFINIS